MKVNKIKELAEKIYYRRTGLDTTKADHEKNIDYATELINQFKKNVCTNTDKGHGICIEKGCNNYATKDYNGHGHWVCGKCYNNLNKYFDEEYR